jgi:hypothetical protein
VRTHTSGSTRVPRVGFGVAPKQAFPQTKLSTLRRAKEKFAIARARSPTRERGAHEAEEIDRFQVQLKANMFDPEQGPRFARTPGKSCGMKLR